MINPVANALSAAAYICLIVVLFSNASAFNAREFGMLVPVTFLSLFVLSAALMGYFFVYGPVRLLIRGKEREATALFLSTVGTFVAATLAIVSVWYVVVR